jgi:hypothetical protein
MRKLFIFAALASMVVTTGASAQSKGTSLLSLGLGQGTADTYAAAAPSYLAPSSSPETNLNAEYWYLFSDDYAFALSGAYGLGTMKWESAAGDPDIEASTTSFKFRVGGDRVGKVGDRLVVFMGPGLEYWSGSGTLDIGGTETESESVSRFGVSGRIGGFMKLAERVSIMGQVGHTFGYASVEDGGAKTTWWPSSFQASWGLTLAFGGEGQ